VSLTRRGRTSLWVAGALCLAGAVVFAASGLRASDPAGAASSTPSASTKTPLASARRAPALFEQAAVAGARLAANAALSNQLAGALAPFEGCATVTVDGQTVAAVGADRAFAPASTLKLVVAMAAVAKLGADHRFTTTAAVDGNGDLVVTGGGDPMLATQAFIDRARRQPVYREVAYTEIAKFAESIAAAGVRNVPAILVDDARHDGLRFLPDWKSNYVPDGEIGALGALAVDGGLADPVARKAATDPAVVTGQRLAEALAARGVTVGGVRRGAPVGATREVAKIESAPLRDIVGMMVTSSDNFVSETLVREIARAAAPNQPATTAAGLAEITRLLGTLGIPTAGTELHDGSGLAPNDRMRCNTLSAVVNLSQTPKFAAVNESMAVAARSGTLIGSFLGDPLAGNLRGKTGSLSGVVGLAGLVETGAKGRFAFLATGNFSHARGEEMQEAVGRVVASYPVVRPPANLVPAP
jgi:D-alanyl-D-alanine carboxypeptidase/D-alanyl-D-alanine-endopeptidase (penicillin-binding protein 4)